MKVLKKILLKNAKVLQSPEMKQVVGHGTGCEGKNQSSCSGSCTVTGGHSGKCGWTSTWGRCTCAAGYAG